MKKIVLIALAVLSIQCTFAQKKNKKQKIKDQHFQVDTSKLNELELDVTNLLKVAVVSSGYEGYYFSNISSPYLLTYRRYIGNFDIHTGFGIGGSKISNVRNDTITRDSKNFDFSYGIGFAHYTNISNRFNLFYGSDVLFNLETSTYENVSYYSDEKYYDYRKSKTLGGGVRPFVGVQFYVHPKISLSTEAALRLMFDKSKSESKQQSGTDPEEISTTTSNEFNIGYTIPLNIKLRVRF